MLRNKILPKFLVYFLVLYAYGSLYILVQLNFPVEKSIVFCALYLSCLFVYYWKYFSRFRKDWFILQRQAKLE
jgi:hypothetical protein